MRVVQQGETKRRVPRMPGSILHAHEVVFAHLLASAVFQSPWDGKPWASKDGRSLVTPLAFEGVAIHFLSLFLWEQWQLSQISVLVFLRIQTHPKPPFSSSSYTLSPQLVTPTVICITTHHP